MGQDEWPGEKVLIEERSRSAIFRSQGDDEEPAKDPEQEWLVIKR